MTKAPSVKKMCQSYLYLKKKFLKSRRFIEGVKMTFAVALFLLSIVTYGYFVNISSTKGYFIRTEREKLSEIKFKNEIVNIDVRRIESQIFDSINLDSYSNLT
jgi:hypothetical protein